MVLLAERVRAAYGNDCGFHFFTDRFYTSLKLAQELYKLKIHLTGTVMANREGCPSGGTKKQLKGQLQKHDVMAFHHEDDVLVFVLVMFEMS